MRIRVCLAFMVIFIAGCAAEKYPGIETEKRAEVTSSGLRFIDLDPGTGDSPMSGKTVRVHYTGYLMNGKKFDSSLDRNEPLEFPVGVGRVIRGWDEGLMSMKVGGKRKLIIPSQLGYGDRGAPPVIPPGADLVFDVELLFAEQ